MSDPNATAPLLSECRKAAREVCREQWCEGGSQLTLAMDVADGIYKMLFAKIASGELMVVKQAKYIQDGEWTDVYYPNTGLYAYSYHKDDPMTSVHHKALHLYAEQVHRIMTHYTIRFTDASQKVWNCTVPANSADEALSLAIEVYPGGEGYEVVERSAQSNV